MEAGRGALALGDDEAAREDPGRYQLTWAQRLKRVFRIDVTLCERCGGAVKIIACIEDPSVIRRILEHVERAISPELKLPPARAPP